MLYLGERSVSPYKVMVHSVKRGGCFFGRQVTWLVLALLFASSAHAQPACATIVSLAPSITEVLFDLGLGDRIVGATRFCRYPPAAQEIKRVGGFYDVSVEQIAALSPSEIFVLKESAQLVRPLARLGKHIVEVDHTTVAGIKESYRTIGRVCGLKQVAEERIAALEKEEGELRVQCARPEGATPRAMVVVGRTKYGSAYSGVYISGRDGFYSDVLQLVGTANVHQTQTVAVPTLSPEGILRLAPDVIVEIVNVDDGEVPNNYMAFWERFRSVPAVKRRQVVLLTQDFASIPGPRYVQLARALSSVLCQR